MAYRNNQEADVGLKRLKAALKAGNPATLYIFHGEEDYLRNYYLDALRKAILNGITDDFNEHRFTNERFSAEDFEDAVNALPMMADRSFIRVDDYDFFKAPEDQRNRMAAILADLPDYCCVVFSYVTAEFKPDKRMKKLWGALEDNAEIVEFTKQPERELCTWVSRHFRQYGKQIDDRLAMYLIDITGGYMSTLAGEIEKIAAYNEGTTITKTDVDAVVEPVLSAVVFDITEALASGDFSRAMTRLREVLKKQEEPLTILGAIGAQFRRMRAARLLSQAGKKEADLCSLCGIRPFAAEKLFRAARGTTMEFCDRAVLLCEETDMKMKSSYDDQARLLELLLIQLAQR